MKNYIRSERSNLLEPNAYISMVLELSGEVSNMKLKQAVENAYQANETTMSKIVLEENGEAYYETMKKTGCKCILSKEPWKKLLFESEKMTFALNEGELIRTFITEEDGRTIVFIHAHHLAGDGKSMVDFIQDIMQSMEGKQLAFKPMVLVDQAYLEKRASLPAGTKYLLTCANRRWKKNGRSFTWQDYYRIHSEYWENWHSEIEYSAYDMEEIRRGCEGDVTVNSYMIGSFLRKHPEYRRIGIPVSIREEYKGMSNQTSGIDVTCRYRKGKSFEKNVKEIHKAIYRKLDNQNSKYFILMFMDCLVPSLVDAVLLQTHGCYQNKTARRLAKIMGYMEGRNRDLGVSNLNRIAIQSESASYRVEKIMFIPPKVSYAKHIIGICTWQNELVVCKHHMRNLKEKLTE